METNAVEKPANFKWNHGDTGFTEEHREFTVLPGVFASQPALTKEGWF